MENNYIDDINVDIHDRVAEAYYGDLGDKLMQETQHRMHWIRDNVMGDKVLDIGCSQGIGPILLGRLGKKVTGVDISQKAVDEANEALAKEESAVKEKVNFKKSDFLAYDANKEQFDTITMTEILEHLVNPEDFIKKAKDLLIANGTLIVTVPFGINDHIDHKKTYYFLDLYQMLYKNFDIKNVSILGKWIGFVATRRTNDVSENLKQVNIKLIKNMEEAFYNIERTLVDNNKERFEKSDLLQKKFKEANLKYRNSLNEMHQAKNELNQMKNELDQTKNELNQMKKELIEGNQSSSFKLGHLLIHETKSIADIIRLPKRIYTIRKKAKSTIQSRKKPLDAQIDRLISRATPQEQYYLKTYFENPNYDQAIKIFRPMVDAGLLQTTEKILSDFEQKDHLIKPTDLRNLNYARGYIALFKQLPKIEHKIITPLQENTYKVLMFLHTSLPYHSNGYATRSHAILTSMLKNSNYTLKGVTRSGYPSDVGIETFNDSDIINDVHYLRLHAAHYYDQPIDQYMMTAADEIEQMLIKEKPSIVHSASAFYTALPALVAARRLGIPFVYEVRGLWEITRASTIPGWGDTERFKLESDLETMVAKEADQVITITNGLREELIRRGVEEDKITIIPNAINREHFKHLEPNIELKKKIGLKNAPTIGYVGSIVDYEGLDDLVEALALLKQEGIDFNFLLLGDGNALKNVREKAALLGLEDDVFILGRVPHHKVQDYYSLIDITPFPRKSLQVCEMVSPLKPFEAMAQQKTVIASNVGALQEIIQDQKTGLLFEKDNIQDLAHTLKKVLTDKELCLTLAKEGNKWVLENRDWSQIATRFDTVYDKAFEVNKKKLLTRIEEAKAIHPLSLLVYGDLNLNYVDGSAVWASSLVEMLAGLKNVSVTFVLKADLTHDTLIKSLKKLKNVTIISPSMTSKKSKLLKPEEAINLLEELQLKHNYDGVILRGFELNKLATAKNAFKGRLWAYMIEIFHNKDNWDKNLIDNITKIIDASYTVFCQTPHIQEFLENKIPEAKGKTSLLPPMVPDQPEPKKYFDQLQQPFKIVYAGKFAPLWGTREMIETFKGLRNKGINVELHVYGDKVHNPPEDPSFKPEIEKTLKNTKDLIWHGALPREKVINAMRTYDLAWAWRQPELEENTDEVSTKFLEYSSVGLPMIVIGNKITTKLLSNNYPLFVNSFDKLIPTIEAAIANPGTIKQASSLVYKASKAFSFSSARANHIEKLLAPLRSYEKSRVILFVGHDLKFIEQLMKKFADSGYTVLVDKWEGHDIHDESKSKELLIRADIIFCEWCLENAVWYSHNKLPYQKMFIRFHRQEIVTDYPTRVNYEAVDKMSFIVPHIQKKAISKFALKRYQDKFIYIPNYVNTDELNQKKIENTRFNLGIVGIVPKMKRFDRALDILENLRKKDKRYQLFVKGKQAKEFPWMSKRSDELKYYKKQEKRIKNSPYLKGAVHYDGFGKDMGDWFTKIGYILSTSDFEGSHLSVAEAMASGSSPIIIKWDGADEIYPKENCFDNISSATKYILNETDESFSNTLLKNKEFVKEFDIELIMQEWLKIMDVEVSS